MIVMSLRPRAIAMLMVLLVAIVVACTSLTHTRAESVLSVRSAAVAGAARVSAAPGDVVPPSEDEPAGHCALPQLTACQTTDATGATLMLALLAVLAVALALSVAPVPARLRVWNGCARRRAPAALGSPQSVLCISRT